MEWSKTQQPNEKCRYNHITCMTPLGEMKIDWKEWKSEPSYGIELKEEFIGVGYTLEEAKKLAEDYLFKIMNQLKAMFKDQEEIKRKEISMTTKQIPQTQQEFLDWFINHYNENNRGVNDKEKCSYEEGCAIGYWLEPKHARTLDKELSGNINESDEDFLEEYLPSTLLNLGLDFLGEIQFIHDNGFYWTSEGLSTYGIEKVEELANEFNLKVNYGKIPHN